MFFFGGDSVSSVSADVAFGSSSLGSVGAGDSSARGGTASAAASSGDSFVISDTGRVFSGVTLAEVTTDEGKRVSISTPSCKVIIIENTS